MRFKTILIAELNTEGINTWGDQTWRKDTPRLDFSNLSQSWHMTWLAGFRRYGWYDPNHPDGIPDCFGDIRGIHLERSNFIFCDGHVATQGLAQVAAGDFTVDPKD